ncbi:uncharacterized protein LOC126849595 [Cataglyphis hispanica]|uniref:uncharacterized protein LOC126849595 n=1 Tax=Cataglyphis hispanica TaxID=1086592 RepID=UPI00217F77E3|nr:uncharacterized protein LOC126849595 [Cataglyphis hispanica]
MEKQHESSDVENFSEFDEKSSSPFISKHSVSETPVEQTSSNREDHISDQTLADEAGVNITKYNCSTKIKTMNLSGLSTTESNVTEIARPGTSKSFRECIKINENDNLWENYERLYSMESPLTKSILEKIEYQLNVLNSTLDLHEKILSSKRENNYLCKKTLFMDKRLNIFENKLYRKIKLVMAIETSVEQASSWTDYIRNSTRQVSADDDARITDTGSNYPSKIETINLPGPSTESESFIDIADIEKYILPEAKLKKPDTVEKESKEEPEEELCITILSSTPKSARNPQKFLVLEFLQKIKDDDKWKNKSNEKSYSTGSSFEEFSFTEPLYASPNTLNQLRFEEIPHLSEKRKKFRESRENKQSHDIKQNHQENNLDNMSEISVEQASPSRTNYVRDDALAENDAYINVTGTNNSLITETNLSGLPIEEPSAVELDSSEIADQSIISKSTLALKSQSLQECAQKIESGKKLENSEESFFTESYSFTKSSSALKNMISKCKTKTPEISKKDLNKIIYRYVEILRKLNSNGTIENSEKVLNRNRQLLAELQEYLEIKKRNYHKAETFDIKESDGTTESSVEQDEEQILLQNTFTPKPSFTESDAIEAARPSTSKSALEIKNHSSQECIQKIENDNNEESTELSPESSFTKSLTPKNTISNSTRKIETSYNQKVSELIEINNNIDEEPKTINDENFIKPAEGNYVIKTETISLPESSITKSYSANSSFIKPLKATPNKPERPQTLDFSRVKKLTMSAEDIFNYSITQDLEEIQLAECRLTSLLVLLIVFLFTSLFYFPFESVRENDEHADTFATAVVEVEEGILDHDATVRVLTEYLERDTRLLKVIALIGDTSVDKPYTVDIIKKRLRKMRNNSSSPSLPSFVVLENLRAEHSTVVIDYVETYQEAYSNQEFTIVAVFKVEQIDDDLTRADINHVINKVKDIFIEANIIMKIIPFQPLSEDALEKYIINTAENIGQTLSQDQIDYNKRRLIEDFANCQREYGCYKDHIYNSFRENEAV